MTGGGVLFFCIGLLLFERGKYALQRQFGPNGLLHELSGGNTLLAHAFDLAFEVFTCQVHALVS